MIPRNKENSIIEAVVSGVLLSHPHYSQLSSIYILICVIDGLICQLYICFFPLEMDDLFVLH